MKVDAPIPRTPALAEWVIVTVKEPLLWSRSAEETWMLNPRCRYILNAAQVASLEDKVETLSELKNSRFYTPLMGMRNLANATILVERHRDRGYGDYLFLTGPFNYIKHVSGGSAKIDVYALAEKGKILENHPALTYPVPLTGPILYDNLPNYNFHWFIDTVTEYDEEKDQCNVYDALYRQLGIDPSNVHPQFKRPSLTLSNQDYKDLDSLYYFVYINRKVDLRRVGYYVVAPSTASSLRSANYSLWLQVIYNLARIRPVVVIGQPTTSRVPATDMTYGSFISQLDQLGPNVLNLIGNTPIRVVSALISRANCVFALDSGPLYIAQALRVPCVSLWGPIGPWARIGYDKDYLDLAVFNKGLCHHAPCFAYATFPAHKCPSGKQQSICEPLAGITPDQVLEKAHLVEEKMKTAEPPLIKEKEKA